MRQTVMVSALTAVITVVLSVVVLNQLGAGPVSSASAPDISASGNLPSSEDGQIQGDTDCDGDVDAVDGLGVLVNVAALDALGQQEPCTDIANLIPLGEGIPGPQGPAGPVGAQGEQGPPGPGGLSGFAAYGETTASDTNHLKDAVAECNNDNERVLAGGWITNPSGLDVVVYDSVPLGNDSWAINAKRLDVSIAPWSLTALAYCATVAD
ncbi:MAG: hypothetical protein IH957_11660 [Chloroflexi bacterium]|nr:hypothetical protein [Chloroflexota bacterium]